MGVEDIGISGVLVSTSRLKGHSIAFNFSSRQQLAVDSIYIAQKVARLLPKVANTAKYCSYSVNSAICEI